MGYPHADPLLWLPITSVILRIVWSARKLVFLHMLDGVEPDIADEIRL
ncbi:hypothetical protein [Methanosarcina sp. UBA411]|nr:hypothetical protein [Methanosarcina sp. UBA411]